MSCDCACHVSSGTFKATCTIDTGSSGVPGVPSCSPCAGLEGDAEGRCAFPRCSGPDGEPRLLQDRSRPFCTGCEAYYRRLLDWLVLDYVLLKRDMPKPTAPAGGGTGGKYQSPKAKSFGHPAEWASVTCSEIADSMNWAEDGLREILQHEPPPWPGTREAGRVAHAYRYFADQFNHLCTYEAAVDTAVEFADLHRKVRRLLGQTRFVEHLPTPCPWCDTAALVRDVNSIDCRECGKTIHETHYEWLAGFIIDQMIADYDSRAVAG